MPREMARLPSEADGFKIRVGSSKVALCESQNAGQAPGKINLREGRNIDQGSQFVLHFF